ncbi:MAG: nitroreductase family deazaflavin-dependent oxidoreductase [Candidatus Nanopelagicales bacterium]|jgi:deazaflavin-dependent oxidoreductase (nitroreductase family)|nr:nitroreductase family deazaflavin-dependent oxidoreductase [Candidatus Nanopelagicales bacterium]
MGSRAYDAVWGAALRTTTTAHRIVHRASRGRLWRRFPGGAQVVWISTLGRRSGQWRTTPLLAGRDADDWVIAGSNAGQERIPGWVFNVRDHPEGSLQENDTTVDVTFTEVHGDEAQRLYGLLEQGWSSYRMYRRNIQREIPVFRVSRRV